MGLAMCNTAIAELLLPMCSVYHSSPALLACAAWRLQSIEHMLNDALS